MFRKKKKVSGVTLVDDVISRFTTMIDELNEGANCCNEEKIVVQKQILSLKERDIFLRDCMIRAETIAANLRNLISEDGA